MNKNYQEGFGVVMVLLVVAAFSLLGFGGYYIYSQNTNDDDTATVNETASPGSSESKEDTDATEDEFACATYFDESKIKEGSRNELAHENVFFLYRQGAAQSPGSYEWSPVTTTNDLCEDNAYVGTASDSWEYLDIAFYASPNEEKILTTTRAGDGITFDVYGITGLVAKELNPFELIPDDYKDQCQCGTGFVSWLSDDTVAFELRTALGNVYNYGIDVNTLEVTNI